jgi:hypothetical protein
LAWLRQSTPENQPLDVWAKEAGMDWTIREAPVRFIAGNDAYTGSIMTFPENKVLVSF